jgi:hypothetical protein
MSTADAAAATRERLVVGIALVALAATGTVGAWGYIGIVPIATAALRWCPAYLPFGIGTCKTRTG